VSCGLKSRFEEHFSRILQRRLLRRWVQFVDYRFTHKLMPRSRLRAMLKATVLRALAALCWRKQVARSSVQQALRYTLCSHFQVWEVHAIGTKVELLHTIAASNLQSALNHYNLAALSVGFRKLQSLRSQLGAPPEVPSYKGEAATERPLGAVAAKRGWQRVLLSLTSSHRVVSFSAAAQVALRVKVSHCPGSLLFQANSIFTHASSNCKVNCHNKLTANCHSTTVTATTVKSTIECRNLLSFLSKSGCFIGKSRLNISK